MKFENSVRGKVPDYGGPIFSEVSRMTNEYRALDLSRSFPDFYQDPELIRLLQKHVNEGRNHYISINGHKTLRKNVSAIIKEQYGTVYDPGTEITITGGASQAIYTVISALVRDGDEVILFEPSYDLYAPTVEMNHGKPVYVEMQSPAFAIDWEHVQKLISPKTRFIVINSPHSPTGNVLKAHDLEQLQRIVNGTDIIVLSDESLQHMIYDGYEHHSICKHSELAKRSFIVGSFGKSFQVTGWRVGYIAAPENLMHEFRKLHQYITFNVNSPAQFAISEYLESGIDFKAISKRFEVKRDFFASLIKDSRFTLLKVKSGFYQPVTFENIEKIKDVDMVGRLIREKGVASVPMSAFSHDNADHGIIRFCFARPDELLEKAAKLLNEF